MRASLVSAAVALLASSVSAQFFSGDDLTGLTPQQTQAIEKVQSEYQAQITGELSSVYNVIATAIPSAVIESIVQNNDDWNTLTAPPAWVTYLPSDVRAFVSSVDLKVAALEYSTLGLAEPSALASLESQGAAGGLAARPTQAALAAAGAALGAAGFAVAML